MQNLKILCNRPSIKDTYIKKVLTKSLNQNRRQFITVYMETDVLIDKHGNVISYTFCLVIIVVCLLIDDLRQIRFYYPDQEDCATVLTYQIDVFEDPH